MQEMECFEILIKEQFECLAKGTWHPSGLVTGQPVSPLTDCCLLGAAEFETFRTDRITKVGGTGEKCPEGLCGALRKGGNRSGTL